MQLPNLEPKLRRLASAHGQVYGLHRRIVEQLQYREYGTEQDAIRVIINSWREYLEALAEYGQETDLPSLINYIRGQRAYLLQESVSLPDDLKQALMELRLPTASLN